MVKRKRKSTRVKTAPAIQTQALKNASFPVAAGSSRRFGGFLIDYLLLGIPNSVLLWFLKDNGLYTPIATFYSIFFASVVLFYFVFLTWKNNGQTIGKQIVGTRVASWRGKITLSKVALRYVSLFFLVQFPQVYLMLTGSQLGIGWLVINVLAIVLVVLLLIIDDEHRGVHDMIAGTWVVRK
ncbi:MAG: RDD family protein [bacterium]|nr:RDD family protein [bacterium]